MSTPEPPDPRPSIHNRVKFPWLPVGLVALAAFLTLVIYYRNHIRARWWAHRLVRAQDLNQQTYYLNSLIAVDEAAITAIRSLTRNEDANIRLLAVIALKSLPEQKAVDVLTRLLNDSSVDVRESAALALAFMQSGKATGHLISASIKKQSGPASAAVMALGRVPSSVALKALCKALDGHPLPVVRAQAAESLAEWVQSSMRTPAMHEALYTQEVCDPFLVLVRALEDRAIFSGDLSLEREINSARDFVRRRDPMIEGLVKAPPESRERTVAEIAENGLSRLTEREIRSLDDTSTEAKTILAEQCRQWFFGRQESE